MQKIIDDLTSSANRKLSYLEGVTIEIEDMRGYIAKKEAEIVAVRAEEQQLRAAIALLQEKLETV